jgi:hypothetical protein
VKEESVESKLEVGDIVVVTEKEAANVVTDGYDYSAWHRTRMEIKSISDDGGASVVAIDPRPDRDWAVLRNMDVQDSIMFWPLGLLELHS